jgi:hypothetical protein
MWDRYTLVRYSTGQQMQDKGECNRIRKLRINQINMKINVKEITVKDTDTVVTR